MYVCVYIYIFVSTYFVNKRYATLLEAHPHNINAINVCDLPNMRLLLFSIHTTLVLLNMRLYV